jgi:CBS domain-containing protein
MEIEKPITISSEATVREAIKLMKNLNIKDLIVTKNSKFDGIIRERDLLLVKNVNTKLKNVKRIFANCESEEIHKIAKCMYENDCYLVAITRKKEVIGQVYIDSILEDIKKEFREIKVNEIMSSPVIFINKNESISKAIELMYKNSISHLPIVENNKLIAIVSARDIIEILREKERETFGELSGEKIKILDNPIISIAKKPVITFDENDKIGYLIDKMFKHKISCLVEKNLKGIITKKDFLKLIIRKEKKEKILIKINSSELSSYQKEFLEENIKLFIRKIEKFIKSGELKINIKRIGKINGYEKYWLINVRFSNPKKSYFTEIESQKFMEGIQRALEKIIRQIKEEKEKSIKKREIYNYLLNL